MRLGDDDRLCLLVVVIGVREDAVKELLLAVEDGYRESTESWRPRCAISKARGARDDGSRGARGAAARARFGEQFDAKYPRATAKLGRDWAHLTAFHDFPAEDWRPLRSSNTIESSFATVRLRTRVTNGAGSKKAALAMAYKLHDGR